MSGFGEALQEAMKNNPENVGVGMGIIAPIEEESTQGTLVLPLDPEVEAARIAAEKEAAAATQNKDGGETSSRPETHVETPVEGAAVETPIKDTFSLAELKEYFGVDTENIDGLKEAFTSARTKATKLDEVLPRYTELESVLPKVKEPFVDPVFKQMNTFAKNTGIKDVNVISKFVGKTTEQLSENPIQLLALQKIINTPAIAGKVSLSEIEDSIAEQFGVTKDVEQADMPVSLRIAVAEASLTLQDKLNVTEDGDDYYTQAAKQQQAYTQQAEKKAQAVGPYVSNIASSILEVSKEIDGEKISVQVSDSVRKAVSEEFSSYLMSVDVDLENPTTVKQLQDAFSLRAQQMMVNELIDQAVKTVKGVATKKVLAEVSNGQAVVRDGRAVTQQTNPNAWSDNLKKMWGGK